MIRIRLISALLVLVALASAALPAAAASPAPARKSTADHGKFKELQRVSVIAVMEPPMIGVMEPVS